MATIKLPDGKEIRIGDDSIDLYYGRDHIGTIDEKTFVALFRIQDIVNEQDPYEYRPHLMEGK